MKTSVKSLVIAVYFLGILSTPVISQTPTNEMANTTNDIDNDDDSSKWGLLGLLGLIGLMGLKKNGKVDSYNTTNVPRNH